MHEYPVARQIIEIAERYARENNARRVKTINLAVGEYSGLVADCIEMYFGLIAQDTMCSSACLRVENIRAKLKCKACGTLFERKPFRFDCPVDGCPGEGEPTEIGREFRVKSIEAE